MSLTEDGEEFKQLYEEAGRGGEGEKKGRFWGERLGFVDRGAG